MSELTLRQQFTEVFAGVCRWARREPWMLFWPVFVIWYVVSAKEERDDHIRRMTCEHATVPEWWDDVVTGWVCRKCGQRWQLEADG